MTSELMESTGKSLTITDLIANKNVVLGAIKEAMKKDIDYGVIPGCQKPSLWKPGAEKLLMMFRLCAVPDIQNLSTQDEARYFVTTKIVHAPTGMVVGYGVGEASSNEEKYKWRKATCEEEYEDTPDDRKRGKWVQKWIKGQRVYKDGKPVMEKLLQVRTNHADLANTILKMADKRSFVGATLKATAASSVFTQDLEELSEELREVVVEADAESDAPVKDPIAQPARASETAADSPAAEAKPAKPKKNPDWRAMESKYDGECGSCADKIFVGENIFYDAKTKKAHHVAHFA